MSIEDNEAAAMRGFLATAFGDAEPPLRDLASGSIARGDAARRRARWYTAGGAVLSVAAVAGTVALASGGLGARRGPSPAAATTAPTVSNPAVGKKSPNGQPTNASAKMKDISMRLPGLLQPLLPAGVKIEVAPAEYTAGSSSDFLLTGPTGTTVMSSTGGKVSWSPADDRNIGCLQQGGCEPHQVAGGTVYVNETVQTAAETVANLPHGSLVPGTENTVVFRSAWMTFVPADRSRPYLQIRESTEVAPVRFAAKAPAGWSTSDGSWPPALVPPGVKQPSDPRGLAISADAFAAMAVAPGATDVEALLDPDTPASQAAVKAVADLDAQVDAVLAPLLPAGVTAQLSTNVFGPGTPGAVVLNGASGQNALRMSTTKQDAAGKSLMDSCPNPMVHCEDRKVPGGRVTAWIQKPTDSNLHQTSDKPNNFQYAFKPDDTSKPAVLFALTTNTGPTTVEDPLITLDQFVTMTGNPHLVDIVQQVTALTQQR
jgi:hypothetical protein